MFSLYEVLPKIVNAYSYDYDTPVATAVDTLTKSGLFTSVSATDDVITLERNGSEYKLYKGNVVVQENDSFKLVPQVTFFQAHAELIQVDINEYDALVKRVEALEKAIATTTITKPSAVDTSTATAKKVKKALDTPADTE